MAWIWNYIVFVSTAQGAATVVPFHHYVFFLHMCVPSGENDNFIKLEKVRTGILGNIPGAKVRAINPFR